MDSITFQKLRDMEARFADINSSMSDQAVATDPSAYQRFARESKDLSPVVERFRAYKALLAEIAKTEEMVRGESDPDMREMAHEELKALQARRDGLDAEIPPLDRKSVV